MKNTASFIIYVCLFAGFGIVFANEAYGLNPKILPTEKERIVIDENGNGGSFNKDKPVLPFTPDDGEIIDKGNNKDGDTKTISAGTKDYRFRAKEGCDYDTDERTMCANGKWSDWNESCPEIEEPELCEGAECCTQDQCWNGSVCQNPPAVNVCLMDINAKWRLNSDAQTDSNMLLGMECLEWKCNKYSDAGFYCSKYKKINNFSTTYMNGTYIGFIGFTCESYGYYLNVPYEKYTWLHGWTSGCNGCGIQEDEKCPSNMGAGGQGAFILAQSRGASVQSYCGVYYMNKDWKGNCYKLNPQLPHGQYYCTASGVTPTFSEGGNNSMNYRYVGQ